MNCPTAIDLLPHWALGRLEPHSISEVEAHLRTCEPCRSEARVYQAVISGMDSVEQVPSERMRRNLRALLETKKSGFQRPQMRFGLIAATGLAAIAIALLSSNPGANDDRMEVASMATDELREIHAAGGGRHAARLLELVKSDANPAVRIAALDSLLQFSPPATLRSDLEEALMSERSPVVRAAMESVIRGD